MYHAQAWAASMEKSILGDLPSTGPQCTRNIQSVVLAAATIGQGDLKGGVYHRPPHSTPTPNTEQAQGLWEVVAIMASLCPASQNTENYDKSLTSGSLDPREAMLGLVYKRPHRQNWFVNGMCFGAAGPCCSDRSNPDTAPEGQLCLFEMIVLQDGFTIQKKYSIPHPYPLPHPPSTETIQLLELLQGAIKLGGMLRLGRAGSLPLNPAQEQRRQ